MNAALFTKSTTALILASGLIAASSVLGHAQDAPVGLGAAATGKLSSAYTTVPTGQATLGGHTFDMTSGNLLGLNNGGTVSYAVSYQNPKAVHLLLNTANTNNMFAGSTVGTVVLTFNDNTTQSVDLIVGSNIREWLTSAFGVVTTVTDVTPNTTTAYVTQAVWTSTPVGGTGTAVIDMLSVPVLAANSSKTLTGVQLNDTNGWGSLAIDLAGLTVQFTPPAPPTPTPTPTPIPAPGGGTGSGDNACGNNQGHVDADKAEKSGDRAEKNTDKADKKDDKNDKDCNKAAVKPAKTKHIRHRED